MDVWSQALTLTRAASAPPARTLIDIFSESVALFPDALAIDNGAEMLTYEEFRVAAEELASELNAVGVGRGDRVGVRIKSGTVDLYVAIMGILVAGAAYVPVDADDPDERARLVFGEADVAAIVGQDLVVADRRRSGVALTAEDPLPSDDAWIIFTSGSTGTPKGVAVSHRSAAAFVDAESRMFLQDAPLDDTDRVMAGLSVAFDASCEEMWLAWAHGCCLVPAPRSLVRSGVDVGPWLVANDITVVSTVPTLVSLWPTESLDRVRLLIMGGEACPLEIGVRLARPGRELWNTYGPTEATVVACGAPLTAEGPVRIGLPLDGWDLAVVDQHGVHVAPGEIGELIIGGVGLARYLDPAKDAEKYAPFPTLGWERAYRSGDLVAYDEEGLVFAGRGDDQVKLGGRRIELGEVDNALLALPHVVSAAAAVRTSRAGNQLLVGYVTVAGEFDASAAMEHLRTTLPAALVPRLAEVPSLPTRTSGKVDRDALPWPLATTKANVPQSADLHGTAAWIADLWLEVVGAVVTDAGDDFFDLGGGSLTAAQMVSRLRTRYPEVTVADLYEHPTVTALTSLLDGMSAPTSRTDRRVRPTPSKTQIGQIVFTIPLRMLGGLRWVTWVLFGNNVAAALLGLTFLPTVSWWWVLAGWLALVTAPGRMALSAAGARFLLRRVRPGQYPRGGKTHLRLWLAERLADELGAANLAGAAWMPTYARLLGAKVGKRVDLHSIPPVTGMLSLGSGCSVEPEVDLSGHWLDGDVLHIGTIKVGSGARVGTRSTLCPGAVVGRDAEVAPGSAVVGTVDEGRVLDGIACRVGGSNPRPVVRASPRLQAHLGLRVRRHRHGDRTPADRGCRGGTRDRAALVGRCRLGQRRCPGAAGAAAPVGAGRPGRARRPDRRTRAPARDRAGTRRLPDAQPAGLAGVGHHEGARRGADLAVPALLQRPDSGLAPPAGRSCRPSGRGLDRAADPEADQHQRRGVPGRRHPAGQLRARRRVAPRGAHQDRQACVRRQLRHDRAGTEGPQGVPGRRALCGSSAQEGQAWLVLAGQPTGPAAPLGRGR